MSLRFALGLVALLAGCALAPPRPPVANPQQTFAERGPVLAALERWELKGRLGLQSGDKSGQASVVWARRERDYRINLYGPFGGGLLVLTQGAQGAELRDTKKNTHTGVSAEDVLYETTGWRIPLEDLKYWVVGLPVPDLPRDLRLDAWGRLQTLRQGGWEVRFLEYDELETLELPSRIYLNAIPSELPHAPDAPPGGDKVEVRLVIKEWALTP